MPVHAIKIDGHIPVSDLGTGTPTGSKFLRDDGTWQSPPGGGGASWGAITGTLSSQTDLQSALDAKSDTGHNHTGTYQPLATVLTNTTASFTTAQETKLSGIASGAEVNVNADWNAVSGDAQILNKPTLGGAAALNVGTSAGTVSAGDHSHTGVYQPLATVLTNTTASFTTAQETKLSGIETGATADMTGAEIVSAINSNLGGTTWQGGGGGGSATTVEVDLGAAKFAGKFTITDAGISGTSKVMAWQAPGPYTGKGTLADEAVMQPVQIIAVIPGSGSAVVHWQTPPIVTMRPIPSAGGQPASAIIPGLKDPQAVAKFTATRIGKVRGNVKFSYAIF